MPTALLVALIAVLWVAIGIAAMVFFLGRRGYRDWRWYLIGGILGVLFVPIGKSSPQRMLGSVADEVIKRCPGPVLLASITTMRR
ncbi:hypothetical protein [Streptomyces gobiensis]|uniref:hypothetical protein n=1 Tax=Streptomyces gobiensis TaxID=2875706 RepID=UPI001E5365DC|nr:hypothetical protein [Streptomyces gobiensis]UGY94548.1 hypothetical protein test1122_24340 [Streptomyces gobiensis]